MRGGVRHESGISARQQRRSSFRGGGCGARGALGCNGGIACSKRGLIFTRRNALVVEARAFSNDTFNDERNPFDDGMEPLQVIYKVVVRG